MIYKILIGKEVINIDEEEKDFFVNNQDKKFIALKSGELVNVAFVQGIIIDKESSREKNKELKMAGNTESIEVPRLSGDIAKEMFDKYKPDFAK